MASFQKEGNQNSLEEGLLPKEDHHANDPSITNGLQTKAPKKTISAMKWQVLALLINLQASAYTFINPVPYAPFLCIHLIPGLTEQNAGSYAGVITTMYVLGTASTSYAWGWIADKYGRRQVFLWCNFLAIVFSLGFGLSSNIAMAYVSRFLLGASINFMGTVKTVCSELAMGDRDFEAIFMGFVLGSRGWAGAYATGLSGYLSDPVKQYPTSWLSTTFVGFLTKYPFFLPNLVGACLSFFGLVTTYFFLPETKPTESIERGPKVTMKSIWDKPKTRDHLVTQWFYSFAGVSGLEVLPLFFVATDGGLSLHENNIGLIMTTIGIIYVLFQYIVFKKVMSRAGLYGSMLIGSFCSLPFIIFTPIATLFNKGQPENTLTIPTYLYLTLLGGLRRVAMPLFMASITIATNRSVKKNEVAIMNGLSSLGASLVQAIGPFSSGLITSFSLTSDLFSPSVGIYIPFGIVSVMSFCVFIFVAVGLRKYHRNSDSVTL